MLVSNKDSLSSVFKNITRIRRIAFDLGQTIVKIAYASEIPVLHTTSEKKVELKGEFASHLYCIQTRTEDFSDALDYLAKNGTILVDSATFSSTFHTEELESLIVDKLKLKLNRIPQMDCLVKGTNFLIRNIEAESFTYDHHNDLCKYNFKTFRPSAICPYLLVNVGTGISVFRVDSDERYERVGGSTLGGGAFFGLAQLLTNSETDLDDLLLMAEEGDHRTIDCLVSDIYGDGYEAIGLRGDIIAGSFGKCTKRELADIVKGNSDYKKDVIRSLLLMISNSVGQLAYLYAMKENVRRIYFDGFLIRNHGIIMRTISYSIQFWSMGAQQAHFLRHEGYTSAIGAYLKSGPILKSGSVSDCSGMMERRPSWHEYYTGCSELGRFVPTAPLSAGFTVGVLELECAECVLRPFPLLAEDITEYKPDVVDLSVSATDREFWLKTMEDSVGNVVRKALESQANAPGAAERAEAFKTNFMRQLSVIREKSFAYGSCTVRNLLDLREQLLNEHGFDDTFFNQKTMENQEALLELPNVLAKIDKILDEEKRLFLVSRGILAGNVFDWGAKKVVELMESEGGLSFDTALDTIPDRPWLIDGYESFSRCVLTGKYKCAAIFVDNSGADFVLGVIPFARELYRNGTKAIIIANLNPALNDLTYAEMVAMIGKLSVSDPILDQAIRSGYFMFHHSGQASPCLDLRKIDFELNRAVIDNEVDLVVIEGMGRALHTNLNANFVCDSLKVAVIKTKWLADLLEGELFSVVFKFEHGTGRRVEYDSD